MQTEGVEKVTAKPKAKRKVAKKKVSKKVSDGQEVRLAAMEKQIDKLVNVVEVLAAKVVVGDVVTSDQPAPLDPNKPLTSAPKGPVTFRTGPNGEKIYKFWSPHTELQQLLRNGYKTDMNQQTGEYTLVPPTMADFGRESDGPPGFWMTMDLELAQLMREKIAKKRRQEIVEVTDDPLYAHI